jgi:hypothetical protein
MHERAITVYADGSILASVYNRYLSADETRRASFANPIGDGGRDYREPHETTVAGCEGTVCLIGAPSA